MRFGFKSRQGRRIVRFHAQPAYKQVSTDKVIVKDYLHDGENRMKYALGKVADLPEPNRSYALNYQRSLELHERKQRTIARRLYEVDYCLNLLGKDAKQATRTDIENLVLAINKGNKAATSKEKTKLTLKHFFKVLYDCKGKKEYPALVDWIEIRNITNNKLPDDLLTVDEMQTLTGACKTPMTKALISIMATFGCRVGELLNLKYKDIELTDKEVNWIAFEGKTGYRRCPYTNTSLCAPYITAYLNEYKPKDANAPLFITKEGLPYDYKNIRRLLQRLKEWTGMRKRLHCHLLNSRQQPHWSGLMSESMLSAIWAGLKQAHALQSM